MPLKNLYEYPLSMLGRAIMKVFEFYVPLDRTCPAA